MSENKRPAVLIAEDEVMLRMVAVETLRDAGYEVYEAGDGSEALDVLQANSDIDLLISDIRMPRMNGYELVEAGTALRPQLRVLLMTGYTQDPIPEDMARAGVKVLYKPFNVDELAQWAAQALQTR